MINMGRRSKIGMPFDTIKLTGMFSRDYFSPSEGKYSFSTVLTC